MRLMLSPKITRAAATIFHVCRGSPNTRTDDSIANIGTIRVNGAMVCILWCCSSQLQAEYPKRVDI